MFRGYKLYELKQKNNLMELSGIEPLSALGINPPIVHRFSPSNPQGKNQPLSRLVGCSGNILISQLSRDS